MDIKLRGITIREITNGYVDNAVEGVLGWGGLLNIRPKYQREFVYDNKKRSAVIDTVQKDYPLNVMYWVKGDDGMYEVMDGQQRTISFCQYVGGDFTINGKAFHNLTENEQEQILDYEVMVYFCDGDVREKLDWFKTINIAGEKLTPQELRNAVYTGAWLSHAKTIFSKPNCPAYLLSKDYVKGSPIRQQVFETALDWKSDGNIEEYMSDNQHAPNANELWLYFKGVVEWAKLTFTVYRKEMKGIKWNELFNEYGDKLFDTNELEQQIKKLMMDDDVTKKSGVYPYVLTGIEKYLNIRAFSSSQKREAYERQDGICPVCGEGFEYEGMEGDHVTPWHAGGKTNSDNCKMLCVDCNRTKSGK